MISCTEFIPSYSELFTFLEEKHGRGEVDLLWKDLFKPDGEGIPLVNYVKKEGIRGCFSYWAGTLNEEAADFTMYLNEKAGWFQICMHHCPSKGRLLSLKDEIGITPYHDYCLHCDSYRSAVEKIGLKYIFNFTGIEKAACTIFIYDPVKFDGRVIVDENTEIMDRKASQNEYFHRDFHSIMNSGINYVGNKFGRAEVHDYLARFTRNVYKSVIEGIKECGFSALENKIRDTYSKEKSSEAVEVSSDSDKMTVKVSFCPAVKHLHETGRSVSPWYRYTTEFVMQTLAEESGLHFVMDSYDEETGAAQYHFTK